MRKGFRTLLIILSVGIGAGIAWNSHRGPANPIYEGHRLNVWLLGLSPQGSDVVGRAEAEEALRHIGTNAIPMMLSMLRAEDSSSDLQFYALVQKQHLIPFDHPSAVERKFAAFMAFGILRESASNAVPELIKMYDPTNSPDSQYAIVSSLASIGPPARSAIPLLLATASTNTFPNVKTASIWGLGSIHSEPETVVPALIKILHDGDGQAKMSAAVSLARFGINASPAISDLLESLKDPEGHAKGGALMALSRIYQKPEWFKLRNSSAKHESASQTLLRVINDLGAMGTNAAPAVPALIKFLSDPDNDVRVSATNALNSIDPQAAAKAGVK